MRPKLILAVSLLILAGLPSLSISSAFAQSPTRQKLALAIGKPIVSDNLTVFLIRGNGGLKNESPMTLQEALTENKVRVHETGDVNTLQIENNSNSVVFIQSGDIIKGGRQDRTMQYDVILPPHSGKLPLPAFCVEQGRWSQRAAERVDRFSNSPNALVGKDLKLAALKEGDQQQVWNKVAKGNEKIYQADLACLPPPPSVATVVSGGAGMAGARSELAAVPAAPTEAALAAANPTGSLEIALENKHVTAAADAQVKKLVHVVDGDSSVIGFAFAINGKLNSADVYGSNQLFLKMWPKELKAAVVEAIENRNDKIKVPTIATGDVEKVIYASEKPQQSEEHAVNTRTKLINQENKTSLMFETIDKSSGVVVHRSYFAK